MPIHRSSYSPRYLMDEEPDPLARYWVSLDPGFELCPEPGTCANPPLEEEKREVEAAQLRSAWSRQALAQIECPLFTKLSPELRIEVYEYVLTPHEDKCVRAMPVSGSKKARTKSRSLYRPLYADENKDYHNVALLQLCQTIYQESQHMFVSRNVHFLYYPMKRFGDFHLAFGAHRYFEYMRNSQITQVKHLHIFSGSNLLKTIDRPGKRFVTYRSENPLAEISAIRHGGVQGIEGFKRMPLNPQTLTITVRHNDWSGKFCENGMYSVKKFLCSKDWSNSLDGLREFRIELEIIWWRRQFLDEAIRDLKAFVFDLGDGAQLVPAKRVDKVTYERLALPPQADPKKPRSKQASKPQWCKYVVYCFNWHLHESGKDMIH